MKRLRLENAANLSLSMVVLDSFFAPFLLQYTEYRRRSGISAAGYLGQLDCEMNYTLCLSVRFCSRYVCSTQTCFQTTSKQCVKFSVRKTLGAFWALFILLDTA